LFSIESHPSLEEYLDYCIKNEHFDFPKDEKIEKVRIMTIHSCKGLEFDYVFLPHWADGDIPFRKKPIDSTLSDEDFYEEFRREAFVAMSRTRKFL